MDIIRLSVNPLIWLCRQVTIYFITAIRAISVVLAPGAPVDTRGTANLKNERLNQMKQKAWNADQWPCMDFIHTKSMYAELSLDNTTSFLRKRFLFKPMHKRRLSLPDLISAKDTEKRPLQHRWQRRTHHQPPPPPEQSKAINIRDHINASFAKKYKKTTMTNVTVLYRYLWLH